MILHEPHKPDDDALVGRAASALRDVATPPGPSDALLANTLAALQSAQAAGNHRGSVAINGNSRRILTMKFAAKLAVAACLALAVGAFLFTGGPWGGQPAFAEILQKVQRVQSVRLKSIATVNVPNQPKPVTMEIAMIMTSDQLRQETPQFVSIIDFKSGQSLTLLEQQKKAIRMELTNMPQQVRNQNLLEQLRQIRPDQAKVLGRKQIDGQTLDAYEIVQDGQTMLVYADPRTHLPVRMEATVNMPALPKSHVVMTNFQWDVPLDPAVMSLDIPAGYTVQDMSFDISTPKEKDLIEALRTLATHNADTFPSNFDGSALIGLARRAAKAEADAGARDAAGKTPSQTTLLVTRGLMFINPQIGQDFHYSGKNAKLNDRQRPIFWYRPAESDTYHVIYADLTVKTDVPAADLPAIESQKLTPGHFVPTGSFNTSDASKPRKRPSTQTTPPPVE